MMLSKTPWLTGPQRSVDPHHTQHEHMTWPIRTAYVDSRVYVGNPDVLWGYRTPHPAPGHIGVFRQHRRTADVVPWGGTYNSHVLSISDLNNGVQCNGVEWSTMY